MLGRRARLAFSLLVAVFVSSAAFADAKSHEKAVRKFFVSAKMDEVFEETLDQMTDVQLKANPLLAPYRETLSKFFKKYMSWKSLEDDMVKLYVKEFTEAEIKEMTRFYETPVGRKVMKKMPQISAEAAAIGQARIQGHMSELTNVIQDAAKNYQDGKQPKADPKADPKAESPPAPEPAPVK